MRTSDENSPLIGSFPSRRSVVAGTGAMVATSQPLAAQAGLDIMARGGNAVDAAVAVAAALAVVEPTGTGIGGDCFALLHRPNSRDVIALDGSGRSPRAFDPDRLRAAGHTTMPRRGSLTVTTPGAIDAWSMLLDEHGSMPFVDVLAPAIRMAEDGYPVSELIAGAWLASESLLAAHPAAALHFLPNGRAPRAGQIVRIPSIANALRAIAEHGRDAFYSGPIADDIIRTVQAAGGVLDLDDLAAHRSRWVTPISTHFRGARIWECPPPGQGLSALLAIGIARGFEPGSQPWNSAERLHPLIEAMRLGFADAAAHVADPDHAPAPLEELLSDEYADRRRALIGSERALQTPAAGIPPVGGTVYLAVVDDHGAGCSLINSNYMGFGSGIVSDRFGIPLQNRGAGFTLKKGHPNEAAPGKRPFHTIIPGLATREADGSLLAVFGVMGGHMQSQGHLQLLDNLLTHRMDPQRALDAPRFQILPDGRVALEAWFDDHIRRTLSGLGHVVLSKEEAPPAGSFGGGQIIVLNEDGVRSGGSDPRKDGHAVAR